MGAWYYWDNQNQIDIINICKSGFSMENVMWRTNEVFVWLGMAKIAGVTVRKLLSSLRLSFSSVK